MPESKGPLQKEDLDALNQQLANLEEAERLIDQSIRGGIDMSEQRKRTYELRTQLLKLKQSFFPGR